MAILFGLGTALAGNDASGTISYSTDLSTSFTTYQMSSRDRTWCHSVTKKLKYRGRVVHFVRTSIPLSVDEKTINGAVYQAVEEPQFFYVVPGDAMLKLDSRWPYSPGVGGFSMHAPRSRDFIVCLCFQRGGVPFQSSTPVIKGSVSWKGSEWGRS